MRSTLSIRVLTMLIALLWGIEMASASPPVDYLVIGEDGGPEALRVYPGELTALHTLTPITESSLPGRDLFKVAKDREILFFQPLSERSCTGTVTVKTVELEARLTLELAKSPEDAQDFVVLLTPAQRKDLQKQGEAAFQRRLRAMRRSYEQERAALTKKLADAEQKVTVLAAKAGALESKATMLEEQVSVLKEMQRDSEHGVTRQVHYTKLMVANGEPKDFGAQGKVTTKFVRAYESEGTRYMSIGVNNGTSGYYPVEALQVIDANKLSYEAKSVVFDRVAAAEAESLLGKVPPGKYAEATVRLPREVTGDIEDISMLLTGPEHANPLLVAQQGTWIVPKPEEDIEAERRQKDAEGRIAVHAMAFLGGIYLANPQDENDLGLASLTGMGLRATYGFTPRFGLECEAVGLGTGTVSFEPTIFEGRQGVAKREAIVGRGQCGVVLRLGREVYPTVRAGLGVQGASHTAEFIFANNPPESLDLDFELDATFHVGLGLDAKLGDNIIAGAFMSFIGQASQAAGSGTSGMFHLGVHVAWTWNPNLKPAEE